MIQRLASLSANLVQFCRFLRLKNFTISAEEEATALNALQFIDFGSNIVFRQALKAVLCRNKVQLDSFDYFFHEYWQQLQKAVDSKIKEDPEKKQQKSSPQAQFKSLKTWLYGHGNGNKDIEETATYSLQETLSQKDFSAVPENEVAELMQFIKALSKRLAAKANRRYKYSHKTYFPDLRQTLRKNLRRGGELMEIIHRRPKRNRIKLLVLCDVSKSMELYSAFLIQFMYAFQQVYSRMETFVFSTSLQRITHLLKEQNFSEAMHLLSNKNNLWGSGTRIGESLDEFVKEFGRKMPDSKTIAIILSDGWDTGNIDLLKKNMEIIHKKAKKLIWLNPLGSSEIFRPEVAGMKAAMPYIDVFSSVHNAESLKKLGKWL